MNTSMSISADEPAVDPRIERTRAAIMEAAADLMMADGPTEVTHVNVAAAANVSRTTVYKHYPTRADLLRSTVEATGKSVPDPADFTGDVRADLERFFADLVADLGAEAGQLRGDIDVTLAMASIAGSFMFLRFMSPNGFDEAAAGRILDEFVRSNAPR